MQRHDIVIFSRLGAKKLRSRRGFTLVEVVISLGIVAFGMVSVMGLLPVGLSTFKQAKTNTVESQIVQGLSNNILLTQFAQLGSFTNKPFLYDMEGKGLEAGDGKTLYTATVSLVPIDSNNFYPLDLNATNSSGLRSAWNVLIKIENTTEPNKSHSYSLIVANNNL